ncbi:MAG: N-acetyltransferase [Planctomyces sp.]|nr:N-acetyltransferase [Planctomyces sp.]
MPTGPAPQLTIRPASPADVPLVLGMVKELAQYERLAHEVVATEEDYHAALFGLRPAAEAALAHWGDEPAGVAIYFTNFSTFLGRPGLYLEDLFVRPAFRGRGVGGALLAHLAALVQQRRGGRVEWSVLDWNTPAIGFYQRIGAAPRSGWTTYRLDQPALAQLAHGAQG